MLIKRSSRLFLFLFALFSNNFILFSNNLVILNDKNVESISNSDHFCLAQFLSLIEEANSPIVVSAEILLNFVQKGEEFKQLSLIDGSAEQKFLEIYKNINNKISYWHNIFISGQTDKTQVKDLIVDKINQEFYTEQKWLNFDEHIDRLFISYLFKINFDFINKWDIYTSDYAYYLFIPKETDASGFRVDNLIKVVDIFDSAQIYWTNKKSNKKELVDNLRKFFDPNFNKSWDIFFAGHGSYIKPRFNSETSRSSIAGLSIEQFKEFLIFLNNEISTNSLIYHTCFGGGENWKILFEGPESQAYNFNISVSNITDLPCYTYGLFIEMPTKNIILNSRDLVWNKKNQALSLELQFKQQWKKFFENLLKLTTLVDSEESQRFIDNLALIMPNYVENGVVVRLAGSKETLRLYQSTNAFKKITDALVVVKKVEKESIIITPNIKFLQIETNIVDVPVIIEKGSKPIFISTKSGKAEHIFEKIDASNFVSSDLMLFFWPLKSLKFTKIFLIKELSCKSDEILKKLINTSEDQIILKNVMIIIEEDSLMNIFFQTAENKTFGVYGKSIDQEKPSLKAVSVLNKETTNIYLSDFDNIVKKIENSIQDRAVDLFKVLQDIKKTEPEKIEFEPEKGKSK